MVHKSFCNKSNMKPRGDTRDCNQKPCPPPMYVYVPICEDIGIFTHVLHSVGFVFSPLSLFTSVFWEYWMPSDLLSFSPLPRCVPPVGWQGSGRTAANHVERQGCKSARSAVSSHQMTTPHAPSTTNTATTTGPSLADPATDTPARPSGESARGRRYAGWT